ncbi:benzil reductase ((S)-benzoin forming) [Alkalibacillus filiformis]|uniref:Benzil reductase ((S)-benzoin forming) n=1 Tax=Alkalibacillus filiformis TaxID=200990 RepID=A0ABU0DS31_9BACI|nr:(S)-benzoin forming benzil reductase [Alkalibacillus filiformis]MDQ0351144.1 benzil reductase ((S)-benzoin forming) [Alkalibacillus filiformis]
MKFAIVTGASRGLGEEVAKNLLKGDYHVITVSRKRKTNDFKNVANENRKSYFHFSCDLSDLESLNDTAHEIVKVLQKHTVDELLIVNNAGMVTPMGAVGNLENHEIAKHVSLNLTAPMLLVNTMKAHSGADRMTVINVTSGAAEKAIYGWNAYSSTKAAINKYTETAALEAEELEAPDVHVAFSPGVMDTDMQGEIRETNEDDFKDVESFKHLKETGQLRSPKEVADLLQTLINDQQNLENGKVYKVYDLAK